ncbi:MAG TPA: acetyl-CoA carboxylase, carboxyltransferase subunit beta [Roseiflexaceae bacterium]|nr:acetyl-CoA carboxylase, carboxyltransferase subunit beta [Roseiflexaceae bacterium]
MKELFRRAPKRFTAADRENSQQIPDNMWVKCTACGELNYAKQLTDNLKVCKCGYHMRLSAHEWIGLLDAGTFVEEDAELAPVDVLEFVSAKDNYTQKLQETQELTGMNDALLSGRGTIGGLPLQVTVSEWNFIGGSMGSFFGDRRARAAERAAARRTPLLTITATGGARQHEGVLSLMQMAKTNMALTRLAAAGQPHFALLVDPCYAGVLASYASVADVIIAEPGARIGFAGRRVIEQTIRQKLPANFQTAEFMLEHGMIDMTVARADLRSTLTRLLRLHAAAPDAAGHPSTNGASREPLPLRN